MADITRIYTDVPIIDEIVFQCRNMISEGIVLKDQDEADKNETLYSVKMSDRYADIIEGRDRFELWDFEYKDLIKVPGINTEMAKTYSNNNSLIPLSIRETIMKNKQDEFLAGYEEQNEYYRMLNGIPPIGDKGIHLTHEQMSRIGIKTFNYYKYIHEMDSDEIHILESMNIMQEIKNMYPEKTYLNYVGERKINPYLARKAAKFGLLYLPSCQSTEVYNKFKDRLEINRVFLLQTFYSEAYKFESVYYDKFIMCMIIIHSFVDMINLSPEYIIQRELFDLRTIQYVFESQGVEYFPEIPLKYQKRLVKNLNRLIKYKSCNKNLIDIVSLFGFDDVKLFQYYILKDPITFEDGSYKKDMFEDPKTGKMIENVDANYELKFLKVPLDGGIADEAIKDPFNLTSYDDFVKNDVYWNGPYTPEEVKHTILEREFNMAMTKYLGMEVTYSLTELTFELCYFINMLLYSNIDMSALNLDIPEISSTNKFNLVECFIGLYSLMYTYLGMKDNIIYNPIQALAVCGFNFETDMNELASYVAQHNFSLEELGVAGEKGFCNPTNGIFTFDQLLNVYTANKNVYYHLAEQMKNANDKNIYDIYKKLFDSLMITNLNFDYFKSVGYEPSTYLEFLSTKNSPFYSIIRECKDIDNDTDRKNKCSEIINYIVDNIYMYLDQDEFRFIFHGIPTVSMDYIRQYLFKVLNFFKSYKVDFNHMSIVYKFDNKVDNWISIIDRVLFTYKIHKSEHVQIDDYINNLFVHLKPKDSIGIEDTIHISYTNK